jgi:hypothetical protein
MLSLKKFLGSVAILMVLAGSSWAQNECSSHALFPIPTMNVVDSSGVVHQAACWNPASGAMTFPLYTPSSGGAVSSVFGRTGAVVALQNDYNNVPNLNIGNNDGEGIEFINTNHQVSIVDSAADDIQLGFGQGASMADAAGDFFQVSAGITLSAVAPNFIAATDPTGSVWGAATGGSQGAGTINAQGLFVNGVAPLTTAPVSSVFGRTGAVVAGANDYAAVNNVTVGDGTQSVQVITGTAIIVQGSEVLMRDTPGTDSIAANNATAGITITTATGHHVVTQEGAGSQWVNASGGGLTGGSMGVGTINAIGLFVNGNAAFAPSNTVFSFSGSTLSLGAGGHGTGLVNFSGTTSGNGNFGCIAVCTNFTAQLPLSAPGFDTNTNCAAAGTAASPSVVTCTAAPAGAFSCNVAASGATCVVNTTIVTANSEVFITPATGSTLNTRLGITCNTTADTPTGPRVSGVTAGTGFAISLGSFTGNPECFYFHIMN